MKESVSQKKALNDEDEVKEKFWTKEYKENVLIELLGELDATKEPIKSTKEVAKNFGTTTKEVSRILDKFRK